MNKQHPYHPIIYVRGFAATQNEIEDAVSDPYMGFNVGATKTRLVWSGEVRRFFFESPLVRLMSDHAYEDVFVGGDGLGDGANRQRKRRHNGGNQPSHARKESPAREAMAGVDRQVAFHCGRFPGCRLSAFREGHCRSRGELGVLRRVELHAHVA